MLSLQAELDGLRRTAAGTWAGSVSPHWQVGKIPCGGYITALTLQTVVEELKAASAEPPVNGQKRSPNPHPDVLTANCHFMNATIPGPFVVKVRTYGALSERSIIGPMGSSRK